MKHDRINPFTVEEYYLLRNNLSSKPEEKPNQQSKRGFDSLVSLGGHGDSKKMRESMRQFAKDNDVIHVTIDRQSLAQLTNLSEKDIKRDENVKLVTNRNELPNISQSQSGAEENSVATAYGLFNSNDSYLHQQPASRFESHHKPMPVVKEQSKDGTDKLGETESRGTLTDKKNMSPRNVLFQSKNFKETNIKFGSTTKNEQFKGDNLAQPDDIKNN